MSILRSKIHKVLYLFSLITISCLSQSTLLRGQDAHYWTHQYGTKSTLLGGAVIGSVLDLSGTYYNPGGLVLIDSPDTLLAAKVFQYPSVTIVGLGGTDLNLNSASLGPAPSLVAGTLKFKWLGDDWLGYSYLSRQDVKLGLAGTLIGSRELFPDYSGEEDFFGDFRLNENLSEPWFGLTWAHKIKDNIGIGISNYLMIRSHSSNLQLNAQALRSDEMLSMTYGAKEYSYLNYRLLWKIGAAFDFDHITLGITLTTPSIKLYGHGSTGINLTVVRQDLDGDTIREDFIAADYQDNLDANYKTPVSLAIGATFKFQNIRLYGSSEWFSGISKYEVISAEDSYAQSSGQKISSTVTHELNSILNLGFGGEYIIGPKFKTYASFTTDFSARKPGTDTNLAISDWDIYHFMLGTDFTVNRSSFTVGLGYSLGSNKIEQQQKIIDLEEGKKLIGEITGLEYRYSSLKLVFGFSF